MPPSKARAIQEDAVSSTKERPSGGHSTSARGRRNGILGAGSALKDITSSSALAANGNNGSNAQGSNNGNGVSTLRMRLFAEDDG